MKKLMVLIIMFCILSLPIITTIEADEYQNYQEIIFDEEGHQIDHPGDVEEGRGVESRVRRDVPA